MKVYWFMFCSDWVSADWLVGRGGKECHEIKFVFVRICTHIYGNKQKEKIYKAQDWADHAVSC